MKSQYRLTRRVEVGDLAELFRAVRDEGEPVVIKLFHARTSDVAYARALAETTRVLSALDLPGLVQVTDLGLTQGRLAVVREDVAGFTLGDALRRLNTKEVVLPPSLALHLIIELLELTEQVHQSGVVHGALTPGNVLLGETGQSAICDFGALKALHAVPSLARVFSTRGRSAYRAPEVTQGESSGIAADVYSLGAIAYELLTLREAMGPKAQNVSVRREGPVPPSRLDRRINSRLDPILLRAIDPSPTRRYARCADFSRALRDFLSANGGMLSREDLARFVVELFPNGVQLDALGQVPIAETFELLEVHGAMVVSVGERSLDLSMRPGFSPVLEQLPDDEVGTSESVPAFEPGVDDGTSPGQAGPLERGWHAPPGQGRAPPAAQARPAMKRMRVFDDSAASSERPYSPPPVPDEAEAPVYGTQSPHFETDVAIPQSIAEQDAAPAPPTEERPLEHVTNPVWRLLAIAGALACVATLAMFLVWKLRAPPPPVPDTTVKRVDGAIRKFIDKPPPPPIEDRSQPEEPITWHVPPPPRTAGFLTIGSDVPALVYIDKQRVRRTTPLKAYPVSPGNRRIAIVDASTGERREFNLTVVKGQNRKLEEQFGHRAPQRR